MVAQATAGVGGVQIDWTAPPVTADRFEIQRSHLGGAFSSVGSVDGTTFSFQDAAGSGSDVYLVQAIVQGQAIFTSNPTVAGIDPNCNVVFLTPEFPFVGIDWECLPLA